LLDVAMRRLPREKRKRERKSGSAEQPATDEDLVIEYYVVCAPGEYTSTYIRLTPEIVQSGRRRGLGKGTVIAEVMDGDVVGRCGRELANGSVVPVTSGARTFVTFQGVVDGWIKTETLSKLPDGPLAIQDRDHAGADGDAAAAPPASAAAAPGADGDAAAAPPASAAAAPAAANNRAPPKPQVPPESMVL